MPTYYLRIEAVNLDHSVYDTHDISTIRGGGFMLLDAVDQLALPDSVKNWQDIGSAASIGLFKFEAANDEAAEVARHKAVATVNQRTSEFATYVSAWERIDHPENFDRSVQRLTAKCRWQQYQSPSLALPEMSPKAEEECFVDRVRPAVTKAFVQNQMQEVSHAVAVRRKEGIDLRNKIYADILKTQALKVTNDLETLAASGEAGSLDGKIAFLHIDGNRFGSIRHALCKTETDIINFQRAIREAREGALREILKYAQSQKSFQTSDGEIRLETLLWGGDEIEWVVPAWQALKVLNLFFAQTQERRFTAQSGKSVRLTNAAGVILCHHNLPILQIRQYAEELCRMAKSTLPKETIDLDANANCFAFLNMVSFDQMTRHVGDFLEKYHKPAQAHDFVINAAELTELKPHLQKLKRLLAKNKLHEIIETMQSGTSEEQKAKIQDIVDRAQKLLNREQKTQLANTIEQVLKDKPHRWYWVSDLWDYVVEEKQ